MQTVGEGAEPSGCNPIFSGARRNIGVTQKAAGAAAGRGASLSPSLHVRVGKGGQAGLGSTWQRKLQLLSKKLALETAALLTMAWRHKRREEEDGWGPSIAIVQHGPGGTKAGEEEGGWGPSVHRRPHSPSVESNVTWAGGIGPGLCMAGWTSSLFSWGPSMSLPHGQSNL